MDRLVEAEKGQFIVTGSFLQTFPLATFYNPSESQLIISTLKIELFCTMDLISE
jgi:hypothetical protein